MKKLLSLVLALVMTLSLCSFASAEGRVDVEFWYGLGGATGEIIKATIEEFNAMQDKYNVIGVTKGSYTETFQEIQAPGLRPLFTSLRTNGFAAPSAPGLGLHCFLPLWLCHPCSLERTCGRSRAEQGF